MTEPEPDMSENEQSDVDLSGGGNRKPILRNMPQDSFVTDGKSKTKVDLKLYQSRKITRKSSSYLQSKFEIDQSGRIITWRH